MRTFQNLYLSTDDVDTLKAEISAEGRVVLHNRYHDLRLVFGEWDDDLDPTTVIATLRRLADDAEKAHADHLAAAEDNRLAEQTREAMAEASVA